MSKPTKAELQKQAYKAVDAFLDAGGTEFVLMGTKDFRRNFRGLSRIVGKHSKLWEYDKQTTVSLIEAFVKQEILSAFNKFSDDVIGADDTRPLIETYRGEPVTADYTRNKLRAEQRERAKYLQENM